MWVLTSSLQTFPWTFSENNILTRIFGARYMRRFSAGAAAWILELNMVDIKCGFKNLHISIFPHFPTYHLFHLLQQQDFVGQFLKRWNWKMYTNQVTPNLGNNPILSYYFWNTFPHQKITFICPSLLQMNLICVWNIHFLDIFFAMEDGWKSNMVGDT